MRQRVFRVLSSFIKNFVGAVVRAVATTLVFGVFAIIVAHFMGVPLPTASQVLREFEGISKLAKVLS
jgi:hypothetical protein